MIYYPQTRFKSYLCNSYRDLAFKSNNSQNKHAFVPQPNVITQPQLNNRDKFESSKEVEEKQKKKGLSTKAKWLIGIGVGITSIIASAALILRRKYVNLQKLYDEKLTPANLAEHIEFKEAETIEEGINFAKNVLGIKDVDKNFTLEAINFTNKGLVDVNNAYKGKACMPSKLRFIKNKKSVVADMGLDIHSNIGTLTINQKFFDEKFLDESLKKWFQPANIGQIQKNANNQAEKQVEKSLAIGIAWSDRFKELLNKYQENITPLNLAEKRELYMRITYGSMNLSHTKAKPLFFFKMAQKDFNEIGINYEYKDLINLPENKLKEKCAEILEKYREIKGIKARIPETYSPYSTIYHEMGHLQDFRNNLKEADLKQWNPFKFRKGTDEIGNRWLKKTDLNGKLEKMLKDEPEKFKSKYPEFYEFLTDKKIQRTTEEVSAYAMSGIGEFIAEVHAGLIKGHVFSDDVMALYKKYNGPMPTNLK